MWAERVGRLRLHRQVMEEQVSMRMTRPLHLMARVVGVKDAMQLWLYSCPMLTSEPDKSLRKM
jgi:hypothetical protein